MKAVFDALDAKISYACHYLDATGATGYPYALIVPAGVTPVGDVPVCGDESDLELTYRITSVTAMPGGVDIVASAIKVALCGSLPGPLAVAGYSSATIRWLRTEITDVDRSVTIPNSDAHPAYRVDSYRVTLTA